MSRYFLEIAYDGTPFCGWQIQVGQPSVQEEVNKALGMLLKEEIDTIGCGRTDTGVHAAQFFVHFDTENKVDCEHLTYKLNHILPAEIAVFRTVAVDDEAHARFGATSRSYQYHCHLHKDPFAVHSLQLNYIPDVGLMNVAALKLMEINDFAAFCKSGGNNKTTLCDVRTAKWEQEGSRLVFTITADRFLRNMVRSVVGTLLDVGRGKITMTEFEKILESKSRSEAGQSMSAKALFLTNVQYPFL
ncbi:MAG: tRNA pseudouridine(38-40) synthase TruA [Cryomorphaceae bacterium]|nr:tRNA pseudouridine(38-40) synthase TruA [Cryomorphaceae bacterium]